MAAAGLAAGLRDRCFHVPAAVGGDQPGAGVASSRLPGQSRQGRGGGSRLGVPVAGPAVLHGGFLDSPARPGAGLAVALLYGPTVLRRIPAVVATLATDGWDRTGFNGRRCELAR